jgi:hypothetical protein
MRKHVRFPVKTAPTRAVRNLAAARTRSPARSDRDLLRGIPQR